MSKYSEALNKLKENAEMFDKIAQEDNHSYKDDTVVEAYIYHSNNVIIEQALQRLESIDNANPSEALEYLDFIGENCYIEAGNAEEDCILYAKDYFGFNAIKEALLKEQEQEKVLEIIKLKRVPIPVIFEFDTYDDYWEWAYSNVIRLYFLSKEEFDFLKKVFCNE